ncbi:myoferlin-like isoform X3 [Gigantopelta aegis]|uniref:myoferlin-like isoform X3 n=1 Tax=Gigantopelta aegis TaxID=1735272 RepID=UPI001B88B209|nr:myoferlin-like isoform X3 [Gigantopelta aegis]
MALQVVVISATNVPNPETLGKCDPYVIVEFQGQRKKTKVCKSDLNPTWNENVDLELSGAGLTSKDELVITIKDWERIGRNRLLGSAKVGLAELARGGEQAKELSIKLQDGNGRPIQASINLKIVYRPLKGAGGGGGDSKGRVLGQDDDEEEEEEYEDEMQDEDDEVDGVDQVDAATGQPVKRKHKHRRKGRKKVRSNLSTKIQDFQIRIRVIQARQLLGANIQPIAKVTVFNQTHQTRVKKSTNSPFWNEAFFFNFHTSPAELFDELIEFQVHNAKTFRSDALIGSFKFDIGLVYDEPNHAFINKWLLLSDAEDTMAGAKGYLKICAVVLGPGDEAPSIKSGAQDEEEDIESNLLRPAGVQLRPATFKLRLYRAEDIPRMDSAFMEGVKKVFNIGEEQKELVDPYFVFSFAGKEVKSRIMYCCDHPEWNQELRLGLQFPSMCERIKFMIRDWDRLNKDDTICSGYLNLTSISAPGEMGFLPTFGPCYINFYGSTREYSDLPDEYDDLNLGKGEGVAYRGRALVELVTELGQLPEVASDDIKNDDILRVQKFMRRRRYRLHAAFQNATMINAVDAPVEFEISIGNYGNKLDENVAPCASTTQPTNAVFDGCHYYFLPWGGTKPCVVVDSHWEDISFRLEALNLLLKIISSLESNIERVRIGIKAKLPTPELAQLLISLLDQLVTDCKKPIPSPQAGHHVPNELDRVLNEYRVSELQNISGMAMKLRENATDVHEALSDTENYLALLKNLATEPQNSVPDVVIWMISGEKRIAYYRIPANELLYSSDTMYRGKYCGKIQTIQLKYPGSKSEKEKKAEIPALLRLKLWLGLQNQELEWHKMQKEGELAVFAETYENMVNILGTWTNKGPTMSRPKFSDSQGKVSLPKEGFIPPEGWRWDSDWYISPELSMLFDKDAGHHQFMEDIYECQNRNLPGGHWGEASRPWTDVKGDPCPNREETVLPAGWKWDYDWQVDLSRAVDEEGFEYCVEATIGGYGPVEKTYHLCRRRRWVRSRTMVMDVKKQAEKEKFKQKREEGWEYAPLFNMKFHAQERTMDLVRRRRWHRKMVAEDPRASCFFSIKLDEGDQVDTSMTAPRMFLTFDKAQKYQLRAYIYQARDLLAADDTGLSDPFTRVSFLTQSMVTERVHKSLCPTWDQTLIFGEIEIHGNPKGIEAQPPTIVLELFDHDTFGKPEFLGRSKAQPMVKLDPADARTPVLQWYDITRQGQEGGELLAAFELFLMTGKDLPFLPPKKGSLFLVPNGIRPVMQRTGIEVLAWGVRNMKKFQLANVSSPSIEFECGGHVVNTCVIKNTKKCPNFDENLYFFDVMLPKEELYMPPMNIRVRDHRQFGRRPTVGNVVLRTLEEFRCDPLIVTEEDEGDGSIVGNGPTGEHVVDMPEEKKPKTSLFQHPKLFGAKRLSYPQMELPDLTLRKAEIQEADLLDEEIDWWSKYYASIGETTKCKKYLELGLDKLLILKTELEKSEGYNGFNDFCHTFELCRGKNEDEEESNAVGEFKGSFRVYPLPPDPSEPVPDRILKSVPTLPDSFTVRVYVVRAIDLQPNDPSGLADPYLEVVLGKTKRNTRDEYLPNTINPVFGSLFELTARIPIEKDLIVRVKDYDLISSDDVIGETIIDLENRFLTKFRATCGLPKTYCTSGINEWRDCMKPKEILEEYCTNMTMSAPLFIGNNSVKVGKRVYNLSEFEQNLKLNPHHGPTEERLALHVLNTLPLVKEHVETRPLFNPLQPDIEQGKLQMWVDVFPASPGPPFNISARKPKKYVLRMIVWNTVDVILEEESITGEKMSDIYVQAWMSGVDERQKTDVHYRSLDGTGNFNWRMVFPIDYLPAEQTMVHKRKEHFWSLDDTELFFSPLLMVQIWDNDNFSPDDFLGTCELNLNCVPRPAKKASSCSLKLVPDMDAAKPVKTVNLFECRRLRGFWPAFSDEEGDRRLTGKLELELELLTEEEANERPAGTARDEPNENPKLDPPNRPETSFLWFANPLKTLRYIIWRNYKWYIIGLLLLILFILIIALFIYSFPGEISRKIVGN